MRNLFLVATLLLAAPLAGCTEKDTNQRYGSYFAAQVSNMTSACVVDLPWPHDGGTRWPGALTAAAGTVATIVSTEKGPALRMSGNGNISINTALEDDHPFPHALSMRATDWRANGTLQQSTHFVRAEGCTGGRIDLLWLHDGEPDSFEDSLGGPVAQGWTAMASEREKIS